MIFKTLILLLFLVFAVSISAQQWCGSVTPSQISLAPCAPSPTATPTPTPTPTPSPTPSGPVDPVTIGANAVLLARTWTANIWIDLSAAHNDAHVPTGRPAPVLVNDGHAFLRFDGNMSALQFAGPVPVRTVFLVMRHRTGLQEVTAPLSNTAGNGYEFTSGSYRHEGSLWDVPYSTLTSNTSPAVLNGRLWINGVELTNPILAPKPRAMEIITIETTASINVDTLFNDRLFPGRAWDGDAGGLISFNRTLTDAERDSVNAFIQKSENCGPLTLPPVIALYGDSITQVNPDLTAAACPDCGYYHQIVKQLNDAGVVADVVEFGVGGQSMQTILDDFNTKTAPLLADTRRTRIVGLQGGGNGLLSYPGTTDQKAAALFGVTQTIVDRAHLLGAKAIVMTMTPSNPTYSVPDFDESAFEAARQKYSSLVRGAAGIDRKNDAAADPQVGCATCADDQDAVTSGYQNSFYKDGTHGLRAFHVIVGGATANAVRSLLP